jgi:DNA polymerase
MFGENGGAAVNSTQGVGVKPAQYSDSIAVRQLVLKSKIEAPVLIWDTETRSAADLKEVGAHKYAVNPTTDVICVGFCVDDGPIQIWTPGDPVPVEFVEAANSSDWRVVAFNSGFDRAILEHVLAPRYGWPQIPVERFACLQASSSALALPDALGGVASALGLDEEKDAEGKKLMRLMSRPRQPQTNEDPSKTYWHEAPDQLERLYAYCKQDVLTTRAIWKRIGLLPEAEQAVWQLDQTINDRGIRIDRTLATHAAKIAAAATAEIDAEITSLTNGEVTSARRVTKLLAWLNAQGVPIDRARVEDVDAVLNRTDLSPAARRVLELRRDGAHLAGAKFSTMLAQAGDGDRVRGCFKYHGAATGRWTAHGVQPQNLKKPDKGSDLAAAIDLVATGDFAAVKEKYENPLAIVGSVARAAIVASPGHRLIAADFSGIEPRVLAWLAGESSKLKSWSDFDAGGDDPYRALGRRLGFPEDIARDRGKVADLAFGFGGGLGAFRRLGDETTSDAEVDALKRAYRAAHPKIAAKSTGLWYELERAVVRALAQPNKVARANDKLALCYDGSFLRMKLPSGRCIAFPFPTTRAGEDRFGRAETVVIFMDNKGGRWAPVTKPGGGEGAWFGNWIENAVQAVARDLLAAAMLRLEAAGYPIVLTVHDEIVAEVPIGFGSEEEFVRILTQVPEWAQGLPVSAKVRSGPRFCEITTGDANTDDRAAPLSAELIGSPPAAGADEKTESAATAESARGMPRDEDTPPFASRSSTADEDYAHGERDTGSYEACYYFHDEAGGNYHRKYRTRKSPKTGRAQFPQQHWDGHRWVGGGPPSKFYYLYRLATLKAAPPDAHVWVTEGEKDADTLAGLGMLAVTNPNGGGRFSRDFTTEQLERWFRGRKVVWALEDNDAKGRAHVDDVGRALSAFGCEVRIVPFRELPEHGDVSDWIAAGGTKAELLKREWIKWTPPELQSVCAADVVMRAITWLWINHFAVNEIGILAGLPDEGKGQVFAFMASAVTNGGPWPCGEGVAPRGNVLILSAEDSNDTTVVPRLKAAGADLRRVHIIQMVAPRGKDGERMFNLATDLEMLRRKIEAVGDVKLVLIDPVSAYLGDGKAVDSFRTTAVRSVLTPLKSLAAELGIAVVGIMHFNKKTDVTDVLLRISDSLAFGAAARGVYAVVDDAENNRKIMVRAKNNLAERGPQPSLAYSFQAKEVGTDPESGKPIVAPFIVWEPEPVDITAIEAMSAAGEGGRSVGAKDRAKKFIEDWLTAGPVASKDLFDAAKAHGISEKTLRRAGEDLGVVIRQTKDGWTWSLDGPAWANESNSFVTNATESQP